MSKLALSALAGEEIDSANGTWLALVPRPMPDIDAAHARRLLQEPRPTARYAMPNGGPAPIF